VLVLRDVEAMLVVMTSAFEVEDSAGMTVSFFVEGNVRALFFIFRSTFLLTLVGSIDIEVMVIDVYIIAHSLKLLPGITGQIPVLSPSFKSSSNFGFVHLFNHFAVGGVMEEGA
jgi:hypothetical protein